MPARPRLELSVLLTCALFSCKTSDGAAGAAGATGSSTMDPSLTGSNTSRTDDSTSAPMSSGQATVATSTDTTAGPTSTTTGEVPTDRCERIRASVIASGFGDDVTVTCDQTHAYLVSDTYPDHTLMTGIVGTNEQIPVPAPDYAGPVRLAPARSGSMLTRDASLGTAINGVPIYDYSAGGEMSMDDLLEYNPSIDTVATGQLDVCGGHAGRGDDYHYHASPSCMIAAMENAGADAIIGWAHDGYPIYGDTNPDGSPIAEGDLDPCNGQEDSVFGYRYHTSPSWPYIVQCLVGEVDVKQLPRVPPLEDMAGMPRDSGVPPQGGVENLVMSQTEGFRTMDYSYQGQSYYIRYSPSATTDCFDFEYRTVTNGGVVTTGTYCR